MSRRVARALRDGLLRVIKNQFFYFRAWDVTLLSRVDYVATIYYLINIVKLAQYNIMHSLGSPRMFYFVKLKGLALNLLNRLVGGFFLSDPHTFKAILMKIVNLSLLLEDPDPDNYMPFRYTEFKIPKTEMVIHERERSFVTMLPQGFIDLFMQIEDKKREVLQVDEWLDIAKKIPEPFAGIPFSSRLLDAFVNNTDGNVYIGSIADLNFVWNMAVTLKHEIEVIANYESEEEQNISGKPRVIFITKYDCPHCKEVEVILNFWSRMISKQVDLAIYDTIDIENAFYANALYVRHIPAVCHGMFLLQGIQKPENPFWWKALLRKGPEIVRELKKDWEAVKKKVEYELFTLLFRGLPISAPHLEDRSAKMFMDKVFPPPSWRVIKMIYHNIQRDLRATPNELIEVAKSNIVLPQEEEAPSRPKLVKIKELEIEIDEIPEFL